MTGIQNKWLTVGRKVSDIWHDLQQIYDQLLKEGYKKDSIPVESIREELKALERMEDIHNQHREMFGSG